MGRKRWRLLEFPDEHGSRKGMGVSPRFGREEEVLRDSRPERMRVRWACSSVPSADCGHNLDPEVQEGKTLCSPRDRDEDGSATTGRTPGCAELYPPQRTKHSLNKSADGSVANEHARRLDRRRPRRSLTGLLMGAL